MRSNKPTFQEVKNGYGFEEIEQSISGIYCTGCDSVHKRPTKMYTNKPDGMPDRDVMCKWAIMRFYGDNK